MPMAGPIVLLVVLCLCFGFRSSLEPLSRFITVFVIICVSLPSLTDEEEDLYAGRTYVCMFVIWSCVYIKDEVSRE